MLGLFYGWAAPGAGTAGEKGNPLSPNALTAAKKPQIPSLMRAGPQRTHLCPALCAGSRENDLQPAGRDGTHGSPLEEASGEEITWATHLWTLEVK